MSTTEFFVRLYPYVTAARLRRARTLPGSPHESRPPTSPGAPLNRIGRQRVLSDPTYRAGVGISTDTLYTSAWLDLNAGPLVLELPEFDGRYYSVQFSGADTSTNHVLGLRTHGNTIPPVFIHGPSYRGELPEDMVVIASPTRYMNMPGRMVVDTKDASDLRKAHELQDRFSLRTWADVQSGKMREAPVPTQVRAPVPGTSVTSFLAEVRALLEEEGLNHQDAAWTSAFLDENPELGSMILGAPVTRVWDEAFRAGLKEIDQLSQQLGYNTGGWTVNLKGPRFGEDYRLRAGVARDQIYVTLPEEGLYPSGKTDDRGEPLTGEHQYLIAFTQQSLPPAQAFWSITAYNADGHIEPNEANVYAVTSRNELPFRADGGLDVIASTEDPRLPDVAWLPTPREQFSLIMRLFLPDSAAQRGAWVPPPIQKISGSSQERDTSRAGNK